MHDKPHKALNSTLTTFLLLFALPLLGHAKTYYLSPQGDDSLSGERGQPWRTLAHANEELHAGDELILLGGEYQGSIEPVRSGTEGKPIIIRAQNPHSARIVPMPGVRDPLVRLEKRKHVVIEDLVLDGRGDVIWMSAQACNSLFVKNCRMVNLSKKMIIARSSEVRLLDNVFSANRPKGDMLHVIDSNEVVIEGNSFEKIGHCPMRVQGSYHVVVRANVFHNNWGRNYEIWASGRVLIEGNIVTTARDSAGSADSRAKNLYDDSIFRYNRVYDNLHVPLNTGSYIYSGATQTGLHRAPFRAINSRFYHNVITDNLGEGWQLYGLDVSANVFQNNIFYRNDVAGRGIQLYLSDAISGDNRFVTNLFESGQSDGSVIRYGTDRYWSVEQANEKTREVSGFWSVFLENKGGAPLFQNPESRDYRIGAESPAKDAGRPLAVAVGSGSGSVLPVTDGYAFYDGFGIEGEVGDLIAVGEGDKLARIERVELRYYQPARLHLDREVSWTDGMPVSLPWTGAAPDMGAYELSLANPDRIVALADRVEVTEGESIAFKLATQNESLQDVQWDFGDGHVSDAQSPSHTYAEPGSYGITLRGRFADGRRAVAALFVTVRKKDVRGADAPWVKVDFEDASYRDTWGYYFKFYRGNQTGAKRVQGPGRTGKSMFIHYDAKKRNDVAGQIAPGRWAIDAYPIIRFDYRIPSGVPVALQFSTFGAPEQPERFIIGGSAARHAQGEDLELFTLIDDGQWHTAEIDLRSLHKHYPELKYLRYFRFYTDWDNEDQRFWFDNFSLSPN